MYSFISSLLLVLFFYVHFFKVVFLCKQDKQFTFILKHKRWIIMFCFFNINFLLPCQCQNWHKWDAHSAIMAPGARVVWTKGVAVLMLLSPFLLWSLMSLLITHHHFEGIDAMIMLSSYPDHWLQSLCHKHWYNHCVIIMMSQSLMQYLCCAHHITITDIIFVLLSLYYDNWCNHCFTNIV